MSDDGLVKRLRCFNLTDFDGWAIFDEAADYIEYCHASHDVMAQEIERLTRDEALTMALEESAIGPTNNTPTGRDSFLLALAASGYAVVAVGGPMRMEFASPHGVTTIELDANAWAHVVAAAQEDSHE